MYLLGKKVSKRDRFGLHAVIEERLIACLRLALSAALTKMPEKISHLIVLQREITLVKQLFRTALEIESVTPASYFPLAKRLVTINKMASGWLLSFTKDKRPNA